MNKTQDHRDQPRTAGKSAAGKGQHLHTGSWKVDRSVVTDLAEWESKSYRSGELTLNSTSLGNWRLTAAGSPSHLPNPSKPGGSPRGDGDVREQQQASGTPAARTPIYQHARHNQSQATSTSWTVSTTSQQMAVKWLVLTEAEWISVSQQLEARCLEEGASVTQRGPLLRTTSGTRIMPCLFPTHPALRKLKDSSLEKLTLSKIKH